MKVRHQFLVTIVLTLALLTAANFIMHDLAANSIPRQLLRKLQAPSETQVLICGNSVVAGGLIEPSFEQGWAASGSKIRAMNAGLGASGPLEHLLLLRAGLKSQQGVKTVVYGFFDFMLTESPATPWWEIKGNPSMVFYQEPEVAARYLSETSLGALAFRVSGCVPMFAERSLLWSKIELLRRGIGSLGLPDTTNNEFGRVDDFKGLEIDQHVFCQKAAAPSLLSRVVRDFISEARSHGCRVCVVSLPVTQRHRVSYATVEWQAYFDSLRRQLEALNVELYDCSDWIQHDEDFSDSLHLNKSGAQKFSLRLGAVLAK